MTEAEIYSLVQQFEKCTLPKEEWTHEAHLIVALYYVKNHTKSAATCLIRAGIIAYNVASDTPNTPTRGYHETITLFWIWLIGKFINQNKNLKIEGLVKVFLASKYAQKDTFFEYYSANLLFSVEARANWTPPDLSPLME